MEVFFYRLRIVVLCCEPHWSVGTATFWMDLMQSGQVWTWSVFRETLFLYGTVALQ
jgi:hypothetical protein